MKEEVMLNLARKWRSKQFQEIIGQELSIRMLKNSLYRDHYFPVYLFSGQRGCGKTTTARVFAAAINCEQLSLFQQDPKKSMLPCLTCVSCSAMQKGKHPDFIEIDAASHTGVDNVRQIVESSSLLPLMGRKKIYLIDEAHMLSKAAFNALLKILEEPPATALFVLATTDPQKIIETVKSRCFQVFFNPVESNYLLQHLSNVCKQEKIRFDKEGLDLIIKQTDGSVRDALNMLEQARFSSAIVTKESVLNILGHIDDERLLKLLENVISGNPKELLQFIKDQKLQLFSADFIWHRYMALVHALIWQKYGVEPIEFNAYVTQLKKIAKKCTFHHLQLMLDVLCESEAIFLKTTAQHSFLQMILLRLCARNNRSNNNTGGSSGAAQQHAPGMPDDKVDFLLDEDEREPEEDDGFSDEQEGMKESYTAQWKNFVTQVQQLNDPLLNSVFSQGDITAFDSKTGVLNVAFARDLAFFNDWLQNTKQSWVPLLQKAFGQQAKLQSAFTKEKKKTIHNMLKKQEKSESAGAKKTKDLQAIVPNPQQKNQIRSNSFTAKGYGQKGPANQSFAQASRGPKIDVSDSQQWAKTHVLLQYFPGTVHEMRG